LRTEFFTWRLATRLPTTKNLMSRWYKFRPVNWRLVWVQLYYKMYNLDSYTDNNTSTPSNNPETTNDVKSFDRHYNRYSKFYSNDDMIIGWWRPSSGGTQKKYFLLKLFAYFCDFDELLNIVINIYKILVSIVIYYIIIVILLLTVTITNI